MRKKMVACKEPYLKFKSFSKIESKPFGKPKTAMEPKEKKNGKSLKSLDSPP